MGRFITPATARSPIGYLLVFPAVVARAGERRFRSHNIILKPVSSANKRFYDIALCTIERYSVIREIVNDINLKAGIPVYIWVAAGFFAIAQLRCAESPGHTCKNCLNTTARQCSGGQFKHIL